MQAHTRSPINRKPCGSYVTLPRKTYRTVFLSGRYVRLNGQKKAFKRFTISFKRFLNSFCCFKNGLRPCYTVEFLHRNCNRVPWQLATHILLLRVTLHEVEFQFYFSHRNNLQPLLHSVTPLQHTTHFVSSACVFLCESDWPLTRACKSLVSPGSLGTNRCQFLRSLCTV